MKKLLSVVLALLMLAVMLPVTAMAAEVEVSTYEQMKTALATPGAYVKLTTDIDLSSFLFFSRAGLCLRGKHKIDVYKRQTSSAIRFMSSSVCNSPARRRSWAAPRTPLMYHPQCLRASWLATRSPLYRCV